MRPPNARSRSFKQLSAQSHHLTTSRLRGTNDGFRLPPGEMGLRSRRNILLAPQALRDLGAKMAWRR